MIKILYSDFTEAFYVTKEDAEQAILEAHAENVTPDYILEVSNEDDENEEKMYSCIWSVQLQEDF